MHYTNQNSFMAKISTDKNKPIVQKKITANYIPQTVHFSRNSKNNTCEISMFAITLNDISIHINCYNSLDEDSPTYSLDGIIYLIDDDDLITQISKSKTNLNKFLHHNCIEADEIFFDVIDVFDKTLIKVFGV